MVLIHRESAMRRSARIGAAIAACLAALSIVPRAPLSAQSTGKRDSVRVDSTHHDSPPLPLFTWRDGALAGGFGVLTVAMFPIDQRVASHLQDSSTQASRFLKNGSKAVQYVADPGAIIIGLSLYGVGRLTHWRQVADLGLHGTEAVAVSGALTTLLKGVVGRARPYVSADTQPANFQFGRGFGRGAYQSFPSGHTTVAFAAAAVVTSESEHWGRRAIWLVAPAMYGGATLVGLSRMYNNAHWASDVALGAAIGTFSGIKVVRFNHSHAHDRLDRWLLGAEVAPAPGGRVAVGWSLSP